jgi:hypothetical protein
MKHEIQHMIVQDPLQANTELKGPKQNETKSLNCDFPFKWWWKLENGNEAADISQRGY